MRIALLEKLAQKGNVFTLEDLQNISNIQKNVLWVILSRLEKKGWVERIERGKYMIIPLGAEKGKFTLNEFAIASLIVDPHCIAYWSALNFYGLTEQIPATVFVQSTSRKKNMEPEIFGVNYKIVRIKESKFFGFRKEWIEETQINITDKEKTIIDCLDKPQYSGGIIEVAKALQNGKIDFEKVIHYGKNIGNSGVIRRLGYLGDIFGINIKLPKIEVRNYLLLDPTMPQTGEKNAKWRLIINLDEKLPGMQE